MAHSSNPNLTTSIKTLGFLGGSVVKNSLANERDSGDLVQSPGWEDPLEEEMATHSSTLARKIPWTEEPGGLQSMGVCTHTHSKMRL